MAVEDQLASVHAEAFDGECESVTIREVFTTYLFKVYLSTYNGSLDILV